MSEAGSVHPVTLMVNLFPTRSPTCSGLAAVYGEDISMSWRSTWDSLSGGHWKETSWVVTALLSLVPAKPMRSRGIPMRAASILTMRLVSQLRAFTVAMVNFPPSFWAGAEEISSTTKSSGSLFRRPPVPSAPLM